MGEFIGRKIHITGIVQGVGFRPFIYSLAIRHHLTGWVRNTSAGVDIQVDGLPDQMSAFIESIHSQSPPLAKIDSIQVTAVPPVGAEYFEIRHSEAIPGAFQPISADIATCEDCLREIRDPNNRRYQYSFTNCTNCGPRFTIIKDIPYDRPKTTMADFKLCPGCVAEYQDPLNRRFHAQPVACPNCGPQVWLEKNDSSECESQSVLGMDSIRMVQKLIKQGKIIAIKGLGGFHLACDATNHQAVSELRRRKLRVEKPFALMIADLPAIKQQCELSSAEELILTSPERPIVILTRKSDSSISPEVAPGQKTVGVMLPYTPLHHLLFEPSNINGQHLITALVMTSGNLSEEPIVTDNNEARSSLANIADFFLLHNRPIQTRCDDSVVRVIKLEDSYLYPIRRSRGYAPNPIQLAWELPEILACGSELKNTFCLTKNRYAFLSHHIGDLENYETLMAYEAAINHFENLYKVKPAYLAYDLHPNYLATRYALTRTDKDRLVSIGVQHHHAHIASCMAEHGLKDDQPVLGIAFDGTGYGDDGAIWGGEFLLTTYQSYRRIGHLAYTPLPGGDHAIRTPARIALSYLWQIGVEWAPDIPSVKALAVEERETLRIQLEKNINAPLTSSIGRLFDAAASLANIRHRINYEAQAAIEFEAIIDPDEVGIYPFEIILTDDLVLRLDPTQAIKQLVDDVISEKQPSIISARFHNGLAQSILEVCALVKLQSDIKLVVLSGGVWQNMYLLKKTYQVLTSAGFQVLTHRLVPANDGGIAFGQAVIAYHSIKH